MKIWIKWFKHGKYSNCEGSKNHKINEKYVECVPHHLDDADNSGSQRSVEQQPAQGSQQSQGCCDGENSGSYVDSMVATVQCPVIYRVWQNMTKGDKQDDLTNTEYDGGEEGVHVPEGGEGGPALPEQVHNIVEEKGEDEDTEDDVI